jgi:hypothetical protein
MIRGRPERIEAAQPEPHDIRTAAPVIGSGFYVALTPEHDTKRRGNRAIG